MNVCNVNNTFRQGTLSKFELTITYPDRTLVDQPDGFPTIEAVYVDPISTLGQQISTAIPTTSMWKIDTGKYFFVWQIPLNHPLLVHQVIYSAWIDDSKVIGEDTFTVLPATPRCMYTPCLLTEIRGSCGCRR